VVFAQDGLNYLRELPPGRDAVLLVVGAILETVTYPGIVVFLLVLIA
jgi:hypothetical protein